MRIVFLLAWLAAMPAAAFDRTTLCGLHRDYVPINARMQSGLLFRIERCDTPPSHLFGTIHSDESSLLMENANAQAALLFSKTALFELVMTPETTRQIAALMLMPKGKALTGMIGKDRFARLVKRLAVLRSGIPAEAVERLTPWAAAIVLQYPPHQGDGQVLDIRLEEIASKAGKTLVPIETAAEQVSFFRALSRKDQLAMLDEALDHPEKSDAEIADLEAAYRRKDLPGIEKLHQKYLSESDDPEADRRLDRFLLTDRNKHMLARLAPYLHTGDAFIAVGALHLPGTSGLLAGLEKAGYLISQE